MSEQKFDWEQALIEQERREQYAQEHSLHEALGNIDEFRRRLEAGADPNERNEYGQTPLMALAESNGPLRRRLEQAQLLLDVGADINAQNTKYRYTALHSALKEPIFVSYLLSKGADASLRNSSDKTPLEWARSWGNDEAAEVLQNATPEQEAVPEKDATPEMMEGEDEVKKTRFSNRTISRGKYFWIVGSCFMSLIIFHIVLSSLR